MKFTQEQLSWFKKYEAVRVSGEYNMFDPRAQVAAGLTNDQYLYVMQFYSPLSKAAAGEVDTPEPVVVVEEPKKKAASKKKTK